MLRGCHEVVRVCICVCEDEGACDMSLTHISLFCCTCPFLIVLALNSAMNAVSSSGVIACDHLLKTDLFFESNVSAPDPVFIFYARKHLSLPFLLPFHFRPPVSSPSLALYICQRMRRGEEVKQTRNTSQ